MTRRAWVLLLIAVLLLPFAYVEHQIHEIILHEAELTTVDNDDEYLDPDVANCPWREQTQGCVKRT